MNAKSFGLIREIPHLTLALIAVTSGILMLPQNASAITLPDASWTLTLTAGNTQQAFSGSGSTDTTVTNGGGSVTGIVNLQPTPNVSASANVTSPGAALALGTFTYYFDVAGPANSQVNLIFDASGGVTQPTETNGENSVAVFVGPSAAPLASACLSTAVLGCSLPKQTSFSIQAPITLTSDTAVMVELVFNASAGVPQFSTGPDIQSASIDPMITFDPGFDANGFALEFSSGVGNSETPATTPLPATLPLFATGLGAIGLFGWRRKRKKVAALAA